MDAAKTGAIALTLFAGMGVYALDGSSGFFMSGKNVLKVPEAFAAAPAPVNSPYLYTFNAAGTLVEAGSAIESTSRYWWLNSGGYLNIKNGRGHTVQGSLPAGDPWRILYAQTNPVDTDNGLHPQNIFRLVTQSKWQTAAQEAFFVINKDNLSSSANRYESNGILLFNRYQDSQNLYYTGIRVDGAAVIKKKQNGKYTTLAYIPSVYPGIYNRTTNPNLLPKNKWIGLRSEVKNNPEGSVKITLYVDKGWTGRWQKVAEVTDGWANGTPITNAGFGGIRTDFMDVMFDNYRFINL